MGASNMTERTSAQPNEMTALPVNIVRTRLCWMWMVPFSWNDITTCVTG